MNCLSDYTQVEAIKFVPFATFIKWLQFLSADTCLVAYGDRIFRYQQRHILLHMQFGVSNFHERKTI